MKLDAAARTHTGSVRTANEDAYVCRPQAGLFAVIDGMGGQEAGEVAAAIAAAALADVPNTPQLTSETVLAEALRAARDRILGEVTAHPEWEGMGAVATAIRLDDDGKRVALAHVGDTRAYLVSAAGLRQLSRDHLGPAPDGAGKRRVSRDLGRRDLDENWVETSHVAVSAGDVIVLASDGLTDVVANDALAAELTRLRRENATAEAIAARLVGLALAGGGPDNVTVVVVRVGSFRRGRPALPIWPAALVVSVGFTAIALAWALTHVGHKPAVLPTEVFEALTLDAAASIRVPPGSHTTVHPGATFVVRGTELIGGDWTITIQDGATFTLDRNVADLDGALRIDGAGAAQVLVRDLRVESGKVIVSGPATTTFTLDHLTLPTFDSLSVEGTPGLTRTDIHVPVPPSTPPPIKPPADDPVKPGPPAAPQ